MSTKPLSPCQSQNRRSNLSQGRARDFLDCHHLDEVEHAQSPAEACDASGWQYVIWPGSIVPRGLRRIPSEKN
jgi:hypothetical protein